MKKKVRAIICAGLVIVMAGCSDPASSVIPKDDTPVSEQKDPDSDVDIDLTTQSATMVYSQVFNMVNAPYNYVGKTVRMEGVYSVFHDDTTNKDYHACIIKDATACCAQGMEFTLSGDQAYPEEGTTICVVGEFGTYFEGKNAYCALKNAKLENV